MKKTVLTLLVTISFVGFAEAKVQQKTRKSPAKQSQQQSDRDLVQDMDSMGSDSEVVRRAREMSGESKVEVVQNRAVDRTNRHEFGINYGANAFGDSYLFTQNLGGQYDYHINNHWSVGARYYSHFNNLTREGKNLYDNANNRYNSGQPFRYPQLDEPEYSGLATVTWYPIYGKTNFFDLNVVHFDFYTLGGYGKTKVNSGLKDTFTAGGGLGMWWSPYITSRLELRWETYEDENYLGNRRLNLAVASAGMGFMF